MSGMDAGEITPYLLSAREVNGQVKTDALRVSRSRGEDGLKGLEKRVRSRIFSWEQGHLLDERF